MCLVTSLRKPLVAQSRIKVVKYLVQDGSSTDEVYRTPYQKTEVKLPSTLTPKDKKNYDMDGEYFTEIGGGYIHACVKTIDDMDGTPFFAYIPKGAEYYVDNVVSCVCSSELVVSDERADTKFDGSLDIVDDYIAQTVLKDKDIDVGDIVCSDLSIKHLGNLKDTDDIIGIVAYIDGENATVVALEEFTAGWERDYSVTNCCVMSSQICNSENAMNDKTRDKFFNELINKKGVNIKKYPAFEICKDYHVGNQKWYLPSIGEMYHIVRDNITMINLTLAYIRRLRNDAKFALLDGTWYWASAENSQAGAWYVSTNIAYVDYWNLKWLSNQVRPVFAITV